MALSRLAGVLCALWLATPALASAHEAGQPHPGVEPIPDRPMGMAEFGLGWLLLPGANVCVEPTLAGCSKGDSSLELDAWQLYRPRRNFAVGAGITLGLTPTTDAPREDPPGVTRDHTRRYLTVEAMARYYPITGDAFEVWLGVTSGLVVTSDRFESTQGTTKYALVGPRGVTIRTEGYTVGVAAGAAWLLSPSWALTGTLRYGSWFLPKNPSRDPFGDEASLRGQNNVVSLGVSIGYRVPL